MAIKKTLCVFSQVGRPTYRYQYLTKTSYLPARANKLSIKNTIYKKDYIWYDHHINRAIDSEFNLTFYCHYIIIIFDISNTVQFLWSSSGRP